MDIFTEMRHLRRDTRNDLNHTYIWSTIAINALKEKLDDKTYISKSFFSIPSESGHYRIKLNEEEVIKFLNNSIDYNLYYSLVVLTIAKFESYLSNVISIALKNEPRKLLEKVSGINQQKTISINDIVLKESRDEIIDSLIKAEIINVFYASPKKQKEYYDNVLGIEVEQRLWELWFEYKATRDIIVHNNGIINATYIEKSGTNARGTIGERVMIEQAYLNEIIINLKIFTNRVYNSCKKNYNK